ncbi:MAG: DUF3343 domain-containing protein [Oscillospiraceae bacterium]|nr:DUF3343 domain-containing protein [Oscillospiraceae bacterium]
MKIYYITFRSVTFAQRAEKLLTQQDIRCSLQRTPRWMEAQGCGYALRVWAREAETAVALLRGHNIPMRRLYKQGVTGELEELPV